MAEELPYQEQREIVTDLKTLFNALVNKKLEAQNDPRNQDPYRATPGELLSRAVFTIRRIVDFQSGSLIGINLPYVHPIASAELTAIQFVEEINRERRGEDIPGFIDKRMKQPNDPPYVSEDVVPTLYRAMKDVAEENNIPFRPVHRVKPPKP